MQNQDSPPKGQPGGTLTLSRKPGQRIHIGGHLVLEVAEIRRGAVRLRFITPEGVAPVPIWRDEIADGKGMPR